MQLHQGSFFDGGWLCQVHGRLALNFFSFWPFFFSSFLAVPLFNLKARSFAPTHIHRRPARTGAVKVGRRSDLTTRAGHARPHLDSSEHVGRIDGVGRTISHAGTRYPSLPDSSEKRRQGSGYAARRFTRQRSPPEWAEIRANFNRRVRGARSRGAFRRAIERGPTEGREPPISFARCLQQ